MKSKIGITDSFKSAAASFGQVGFTTKEFIDRYHEQAPAEWRAIVKRYGAGGKGSGHPYSANSRAGSLLAVLFRSGDLQQFPYVPAPPDWGNKDIRQWAVSLSGTLADERVRLAPADSGNNSEDKLPDWSDIEYREGTPQLRTHLRRERHPKLSGDKKKQFRSKHGKLFCERCKICPSEIYGDPVGEAAIEVHHAVTTVGVMQPNHVSKLSDLQCLCANCHRVVHAELRAISEEKS